MKICKKKIVGILLITLILCPAIINCINSVIKEESSLQVKTEINDENDVKNPKKADAFVPDPAFPHNGMEWNFTTDTIIGWRQYSFWGVSDYIYNISELKYFDESENVTGSDEAYYGVALTPAFWNVSTQKVEEFSNRTVFPILNVSLINYTIPSENGFSNRNMFPSPDPSPDYILNLFIPKNSSDVLDIHWCANATHWLISAYLNGILDEENGGLITPQSKEDLVELTVTPNSIHYVNPARETYCHLFYYDNGTLRTGEIYTYFSPEMIFKINRTRIFDFNPLNELKWSEDFDVLGEELFVGMDTNETKLVFNHTVNNMELEIEWDDEYNEWEIELLYYQEIWANVSYWHYEDKKWVYLNCTPVASANDMYPIVFGGDDDEDNDEMLLPPFLLIPNQSTFLSLGDVFKIFELNPEWSDLRVETEDKWVKLTNTTTSNIVVFSYQIDGILEYIYIQEVEPFKGLKEEGYDEDIMFYYKNFTTLPYVVPIINTFSLHTFDLGYLSASINISVNPASGLFHSGFPYNPTNQSISNALGFFDIFMEDETALDQTYFAPINITFYYDHTTYKSVKVYWFNMSADNHKGAWEEIPIKNLGNGVIVVTLNHTSIIVFTASKIVSLPSDGDNGNGEEEKPAIPFGNYFLIFMALAIIGLVIYKKRNF